MRTRHPPATRPSRRLAPFTCLLLAAASCAHAAEGSLGIVHMLATEAGAVAIFESCPLERFVRDMHAAVKHVAMNPFSYVVAGRLSLGLDPGVTRL